MLDTDKNIEELNKKIAEDKEKELDREKISQILRRLSQLEQHIINMIVPLQSIGGWLGNPHAISELRELSYKKIQIEDGELKKTAREFSSAVHDLQEISSKFDSSQFLNEIKYMGKRLHQIEHCLMNMTSKEKSKPLKVKVYINDCEYEKEEEPIVPELKKPTLQEELELALKTVNPRHRMIFFKKEGLFGEKNNTKTQIAKQLGISNSRVSQVLESVSRKIRSQHAIKKFTNSFFEAFK